MTPRLTALLWLAFPLGAVAQAPEEAIEVEEQPAEDQLDDLDSVDLTADEAFAIGVRAFEAKRYEEAERAWERADALEPNPVLWVAIADTREARDDEPGTVAALERYLTERPDAPDKLAVEARIASLLKTPASVVVRSLEEGHAILLDGKPIDRKTPATLELEPGEHTILVVGDGVQVGEKTIQVGYGEQRELIFTPKTESAVVVEQAPPEVDFEAEDRTAKRAVWSLTGIAAASLVTGGALGIAALKKEQKFQDDPTNQLADQGNRLALFADVSFGIAALSAITALTVFLTTRNKKKRRERETARVRFEPRGLGAAAIRF